jgi:uncharacterized membrane protein YphA (DoxX/SURF4 family)
VSLDERDVRRIGYVLLAISTAALGVLSLTTGEFAYTWQPVPEGLPGREVFARLVGAALIGVSALLLVPRTARQGLGAMIVVFAAWLLALHVPELLFRGGWLGFCEFLLPLGACLATAGVAAQDTASGIRHIVAARILFGVGLLGCGLSHFLYATFAAEMIPEWMPARLFFTYLTGAGHLAAGLSLLSGVALRLSSALLCFMLACFVLLLHVPRVLATPNRYECTMLIVALLFNGAAWLMAAAVRAQRVQARRAFGGRRTVPAA